MTCSASSPGTGTTFALTRGAAKHGRVMATYGRDEVLLSDGSQTLAFSVRDGTWRAFGLGCTALFYEVDADAVVASFSTGTYELEREGTLTDNGSALALTLETPAVEVDPSRHATLQRIYVEANLRSQSLIPTLLVDNTEVVLSAITNAVRGTVEIAQHRTGRVFGLRLDSTTLTDRVDVFGVEMDLYAPKPSGGPGS